MPPSDRTSSAQARQIHAQCATEVCQMATLLHRGELSHEELAKWVMRLANKTCNDAHAPEGVEHE